MPRRWFELGPFTVFDVETTGMSPREDRIVEIGAVRISQAGIHDRFQTLVNPGRPIPPDLTAIHHITDDMVAGAPNFARAGREFLEFAAGTTLVAHNARFDLAFLQESLQRENLPLWQGPNCKTLDSIPIIKAGFPGMSSYALQNLRFVLGLGLGDEGPAHCAGADVEWTLEVFAMAMQRLLDRE